MKVIYVAKHNSGDNDDEGSIAFALERLGHEVIRIHERKGHKALKQAGDFVLFHKWEDITSLARLKVPAVCWFFDLISHTDSTLRARWHSRTQWLESILPHCLLGFLTDGDAVARDQTGKLVHLLQGADERVLGPGTPRPEHACDLLFTGTPRHGRAREEHVAELRSVYGSRFCVLGEGGPQTRRHGRELADILASAKIVVAPDGPQTDLYWSNRVYLTLGFGGFLLHPWCAGLAKHYTDGVEIAYYRDRAHFHERVRYYLEQPDLRIWLAANGLARTRLEHLYRHRVQRLVEIVKERLCIG